MHTAEMPDILGLEFSGARVIRAWRRPRLCGPPSCRGRVQVLAMISMAQLIVRDIDDEVVRALKRRAASRGVSAEAEHRAILKSTLLGQSSTRSFKQALLAMPDAGEDSDFVVAREQDRKVDLGTGSKPKRAGRAKRSRS